MGLRRRVDGRRTAYAHRTPMITVRFLAGPDVEADERAHPGALAAAVLRAHVEADLAADACGDDSDVRHPCREINARACCRRVGSAARETLKIATATRK